MTRTPALFVGHGSPMSAIEESEVTRAWAELGRRIGKPKQILVVSAHWETKGVLITAAERPRTIHDFYNFPPALYAIEYPAPGAPAFAKALEARLAAFGARADLDGWGLDHGAWSVLRWMYPDADVPVVQLSLDLRRSPEQHFAIGRELAALRDEGVLVLGTGNIVHNFAMLRGATQAQTDATVRFEEAVIGAIADEALERVVDWQSLAPGARLAVPENDHFLPLLYVLGARAAGEPAEVLNRVGVPGISMTSIAFGLS